MNRLVIRAKSGLQNRRMGQLDKIRKIPAYIDRYGWRSAVRRGRGEIGRLIAGPPSGHSEAQAVGKMQIIGHFEAILGKEQGTGKAKVLAGVPRDSITWVVPDFSPGSGGHTTILRFVHGLEKLGWHNQTVVIQAPYRWADEADALNTIRRHFFPLKHTKVVLGCENIPPSRFLFATGWQTAYWVAKYKDAVNKFYFVQDFEPSFYPVGTESLLAEDTYRLGLNAITAGDWLKNKLARDYGMSTQAISFSCDHDIYKPAPRRPGDFERHVFFYARPVTPRRAFELGALALKRVCEARGDTAAILAGWDLDNYEIPFPHLDAKVLSPSGLADMFTQCEAALVLSTTNMSLMPLEAMSSGCPLVINRGENNEWLVDESLATFCDLTVDSITDSLLKVLKGGRTIEAKRKKALKVSASTSWDKEVAKFDSYLRARD